MSGEGYTVDDIWPPSGKDQTCPVSGCSCGWSGTFEDCAPVEDCILTAGDPSPAGRCPECGELVYPDTDEDDDAEDARESARYDMTMDLRAMVLGALTAAARIADEEDGDETADAIVRGLLLGQDKETCGALAVPFRQWWQAPMRHPLQVGTLVLSTHGEADSGGEPEEDRETGPVAVGQIISADEYESQGWTYGVVFANHTVVNITAFELADLDAYAVAPAPFIAPEGV